MYEIKLNGTKFYEVKPAFYAKEMGEKFKKNPDLWYETFQTKEFADTIRSRCNDDYESIWTEHCSMCWDTINKNTSKRVFRSEDNLTWLCKQCMSDLVNMPQNEVE